MKIKAFYLSAVAAIVTGLVSCDNAELKYDDVTGPGRLFLNEAVGTAKSVSFVIPAFSFNTLLDLTNSKVLYNFTSLRITALLAVSYVVALISAKLREITGYVPCSLRNLSSFQMTRSSKYLLHSE